MCTRSKIAAGTVVLAFAIAAAAASARAATITELSEFDYPSTGASTLPYGINNSGAIVGIVVNGTMAGFERFKTGKFVPLSDPSGNGLDTQAFGINDSGAIDGIYENATTSAIIGFTLTKGVYADFLGAPAECNSAPCVGYLLGINNGNNLAGVWFPPGSAVQAFAVLGGVFTPITSSLLATGAVAYSINNKSTVVVGYYVDSSSLAHGFSYTVAGGAIKELNYPGGTQTIIFGNNNSGTITGYYIDAGGVAHGLARIAGHWATYDFAGATGTTLEYVNDKNVATGQYTDTAGVTHGLTLQIAP